MLPLFARKIYYRLKPADNSNWETPFETLRERWGKPPSFRDIRVDSTTLLQMSDEDLFKYWKDARNDITTGPDQFQHRGWYYELYKNAFKNKNLLDVGCGLGFDSVTFATQGAHVTFADISNDNIRVVARICRILDIEANFLYIESLDSLKQLPYNFDVITAFGSLHHAPRSIVIPEIQELISHLQTGGRWLQVAYPKTRWEREGCLPFEQWGKMTDGEETPWAEWYDCNKIHDILGSEFAQVLCYEFHNHDFIFFDFVKTD